MKKPPGQWTLPVILTAQRRKDRGTSDGRLVVDKPAPDDERFKRL
jgi:hypothetical protein